MLNKYVLETLYIFYRENNFIFLYKSDIFKLKFCFFHIFFLYFFYLSLFWNYSFIFLFDYINEVYFFLFINFL